MVMKVPTYRRQTKFPTRTGAQFLSVQASPGAFAAPGVAMQNFGQVVQTEGLRWLAKEIETERTATQAANTNAFEGEIARVREGVNTSNVEDWQDPFWSPAEGVPTGVSPAHQQIEPYAARRKRIETDLHNFVNRQASKISNRTARAGFVSAAHKRIATVMPGLSTTLRGRYNDYAAAQLEIVIDGKIKEAAEAGHGKVEPDILTDLDGLIEWWGAWGGHKREAIEKRKKDARSDVDEYRVRTALTVANAANDEGGVEAVINALDGDVYPNLSPGRAAFWFNKAVILQDRIQSHNIAADEAADRKVDKERKDTQLFNEEEFTSRVQNARDALADGDIPETSLLDLRDEVLEWADDNRKLLPAQRDRLIEQIEGEDKINDRTHYHDMLEAIDEAVTDDDLDYIDDQLNKEYPVRRIGYKAYKNLTERIQDRRGKTEQDAQRKAFKKSLSTILGGSQLSGDAGLGMELFGLDPASPDRINLSLALREYEDMIDAGKRPAVAFYDMLQKSLEIGQRKMVAANLVMRSVLELNGESVFGYVPGMPVTEGNVTVFLTQANLQKARDALKFYAQGKNLPDVYKDRAGDWINVTRDEMARLQRTGDITAKHRLTVRRLVQMERELEFLQNGVVHIEPPTPPEEKASETGELIIITPEEDTDFLDDASDWASRAWGSVFGGGEPESEAEKAKKRGMGGGS